MATCNLYEKGYKAGYKMGWQSGLKGSKARDVMQKDLIFIYGTMAIVLKKKRGWKTETIEKLIEDIQKEWCAIERSDEYSNESMAEHIYKVTGVELEQICQEILDMEVD